MSRNLMKYINIFKSITLYLTLSLLNLCCFFFFPEIGAFIIKVTDSYFILCVHDKTEHQNPCHKPIRDVVIWPCKNFFSKHNEAGNLIFDDIWLRKTNHNVS